MSLEELSQGIRLRGTTSASLWLTDIVFPSRQVPLDKGYFVHDDLRMVITDDERNHLLMSEDDEKRSFGSR